MSELDEAAPHRSSKDAKRWCRGKEGVPHVFVVVLDERYGRTPQTPPPCRWSLWLVRGRVITRSFHYNCKHQLACQACGRIDQFRVEPAGCPEYRKPPADPMLLSCRRCGCTPDEHDVGDFGRCRNHGTCPTFFWEDL